MRKKLNVISIYVAIALCLVLQSINVFAAKRYGDVKTDSWYNECVYYCADNEIMIGVSDDRFEPNRTITRAEFITALYRLAGSKETVQENHFVDVPSESYYADAVLWGVENKIVYGMTETSFAPDEEIIREDIACLIARYVTAIQADFLENGLIAEIAFSDAADVSDYAKASVSLVSKHSLMLGNADGTFKPQDKATRAEAASVFMQLQNKLKGMQQGVIYVYNSEDGSITDSYTLTEGDTVKLRKLLRKTDTVWTEFFVPEYITGYELVLDDVKYQFESLECDSTLPIRCANVYGDVVYGIMNKDGNTLKQVYEILLEVCSE